MILFLSIISFVILQRLGELIVAKNNAAKMFAKGAKEYDVKGYRYIVILHVSFFISLFLEFFLLQKGVNKFWYFGIVLFFLAQVLRYWSLISLGEFWNTRIIVLPQSRIIRKGPYKYLSHPNYAAVITELAVLPLIFSCYFTSIVFTILNLFILRRRIEIENTALGILKPD